MANGHEEVSDAVTAARRGSRIRVEVESGTINVDGRVFQAPALPPFMVELVQLGGLAAWIRAGAGRA